MIMESNWTLERFAEKQGVKLLWILGHIKMNSNEMAGDFGILGGGKRHRLRNTCDYGNRKIVKKPGEIQKSADKTKAFLIEEQPNKWTAGMLRLSNFFFPFLG